MRRKNQEEPATPATGARLPTMGAESSLGPATRFYRSPMTAGVSGGSAVLPSQLEDESESEEVSDESVEVTADESDELAGDAGESDGDDDSTEDEG